MYRIATGTPHNLPDVESFLETLSRIETHSEPEARILFAPNVPLVVARAPGRLDVMGGIADYSGALVLQLPLREATLVALQRDSEPRLRIVSLGARENGRAPAFEMPFSDFERAGSPLPYEEAHTRFRSRPDAAWAAYVAGAFLVLMRERNLRFPGGARILVASGVPEGKGVSSSAALEVAVMQAVAAAFDVPLEPRDLALLCQKVENLVVGAPCGIMDQMAAVFGRTDRLMALLCQPAELRDPVEIPPGIRFWGLDSGIRHAVSGADYGSVRTGAFMGYRILADLAGLRVDPAKKSGPVRISDPTWNGYLANLPPSVFEQHYAARLPERMSGRDFLARYGGTTDPVTRVDSDRDYAVRVPTAHPVREHFRVRTFAQLLRDAPDERRLELLGELMYQSHASYSACGLGSDGTDRLVALAREAGPARGLYGAKITGGGSGGTVALLGRADAGETVAALADRYAGETGRRPYLFSGSSSGAAAFGCLHLRPESP